MSTSGIIEEKIAIKEKASLFSTRGKNSKIKKIVIAKCVLFNIKIKRLKHYKPNLYFLIPSKARLNLFFLPYLL